MLRFGFTYRLSKAGKEYVISAQIKPDAIMELAARAAAIRIGNFLREHADYLPARKDLDFVLTMSGNKVIVNLVNDDLVKPNKQKPTKKYIPQVSITEPEVIQERDAV